MGRQGARVIHSSSPLSPCPPCPLVPSPQSPNIDKLIFKTQTNSNPGLDTKISGKVLRRYFFIGLAKGIEKHHWFFTDHKHGSVERTRFIKSGRP
jgi:hypothetical protein